MFECLWVQILSYQMLNGCRIWSHAKMPWWVLDPKLVIRAKESFDPRYVALKRYNNELITPTHGNGNERSDLWGCKPARLAHNLTTKPSHCYSQGKGRLKWYDIWQGYKITFQVAEERPTTKPFTHFTQVKINPKIHLTVNRLKSRMVEI